MTALKIEVLTFAGCPHAEPALKLTRQVVERLVPHAHVQHTVVQTDQHAQQIGFLGSPSIRVNGTDIEGTTSPGQGALSCRLYECGAGVPPEWLIEAGILRALRPRHLLFLCVANSARSQMAEGVARALAPADVNISSAGSEPSTVRPLAVQALQEIGIDISHHHAKGIDAINAATVDAVITLCAEEVCPLFLGRATRLHWALPDPARVQGTEEQQLHAFRQAREELLRRLRLLFPGWRSEPRTEG